MGCLGTVEQRYLVNLIKNAAKNGYTRFVEPCAGTFAMSNLAIQNGYKPEQIETSDVSMMSSVMGYAITGKPLDELEIHAQGFSDEELLDPAVALYAQMYLRTSKTAGNEYFFNLLKDLRDRREEHIEHIRNVGAAVHSMIDAANEKMDDAGFDLDMDWTYLAKVFGSAAIPVESAEVIKKALKKAEKDGTITSKNKWQMIEYWAADYLAGK